MYSTLQKSMWSSKETSDSKYSMAWSPSAPSMHFHRPRFVQLTFPAPAFGVRLGDHLHWRSPGCFRHDNLVDFLNWRLISVAFTRDIPGWATLPVLAWLLNCVQESCPKSISVFFEQVVILSSIINDIGLISTCYIVEPILLLFAINLVTPVFLFSWNG